LADLHGSAVHGVAQFQTLGASAMINIMMTLLAVVVYIVIGLTVQIPLVWIGEIVKWAFSLGRHSPQWDCYISRRIGPFILLTDISGMIGLATVIIIAITIKTIFFSHT
jgi:hypothetical protein